MGTLAKVAMGVAVAKGVGKMLGGGRGGSSGGGLGGLLGSLTGGGGSKGGGLGGILDSLGGGSNLSKSQNGGGTAGGLGDLFNNALQGKDTRASSEEDEKARILLLAMINAAKADGDIDKAEQQKITQHLGDVSDEDARFVRAELNTPLDVRGFINDVPRGMEQQVYLMSLLAIDLDSSEEAHYLDQLAKGLNMSHQACNDIHEQVGAPNIYS